MTRDEMREKLMEVFEYNARYATNHEYSNAMANAAQAIAALDQADALERQADAMEKHATISRSPLSIRTGS